LNKCIFFMSALFMLALTMLLIIRFTPQAMAEAPRMEWERAYGGPYYDYGSSVWQAADNGFVVTGGVSPSYKGDRNALLLKADENGKLLWNKSYGGPEFDYGYSVRQTRDGGYIVAGTTMSFGNGSNDVYLVKTDGEGNLQWQSTYGGALRDEGLSVLQAPDGGYIIAGFTNSFGNLNRSTYLVRVDGAGSLIWQKTYGGPYGSVAISLEPTLDGGYVLAGYMENAKNIREAYLVKVDVDGNEQWERTFGGAHDRYAYMARQTEDGGYIVTGYEQYGPGASGIILLKTDGDGNLLWQKAVCDSLKGYNVYPTRDGGYVIIGIFKDGPADKRGPIYEGLLVKTSANGDVEWQKAYGGAKDIFIRTGVPTSDGGLAIVGSTGDRDDVETWDVYLAKLR
jgi:hypothetical protein